MATVTVTLPATPPGAVAEIVVVPVAKAVTMPEVFTIATNGLLLSQKYVTPGTAALCASRAVAVSCCVAPGALRIGASGVTVTVAPAIPFRIVPASPTTHTWAGELPHMPHRFCAVPVTIDDVQADPSQ
jgi:hypothetical protein